MDAREPAQRYKIGKFILEMKRVVPGVCWEDISWSQDKDKDNQEQEQDEFGEEEGNVNGDGIVVFDSEDEDECEDLFAGVWDAEVVRKRRGRRFGGWRGKSER